MSKPPTYRGAFVIKKGLLSRLAHERRYLAPISLVLGKYRMPQDLSFVIRFCNQEDLAEAILLERTDERRQSVDGGGSLPRLLSNIALPL